MAQQLTTRIAGAAIEQSDLLKVWYEVENGVMTEFREPEFMDWKVVEGPVLESVVNHQGGQSHSRQAYVFYLQPLRTGTLVVPAAMARIEGSWMSSKAVIISVSKGNTNTPPVAPLRPPSTPVPATLFGNAYDGYLLREGEDASKKIADNLFVEVETSKSEVYDGEPVVVTYLMYCRVDLEARITRRPTFSGCTAIDMPTAADGQYRFQNRNGKQFKVYEIRKVQLYPLQAGEIGLEPLEIDAVVRFTKVPNRLSGYERYRFYDPDNEVKLPYLLKSTRKTIAVKPIPDNRNVLVGKYSIVVAASDSMLDIGEPSTIRVTIQGSGRWPLFPAPIINWPDGLQVFAAQTSSEIDSLQVPLQGQITYKFPVAPTRSGTIALPAIELNWFDPSVESFGSSQSEPVFLQVSNNVFQSPEAGVNQNTRNGSYSPFARLLPFAMVAFLLIAWIYHGWRKRKNWQKLPPEPDKANTTETQAASPEWAMGKMPDRQMPATPFIGSKPAKATATPKADPIVSGDANSFFHKAKQLVGNAVSEYKAGSMADGEKIAAAQAYISYCNQWLYAPATSLFFEEEEQEKVQRILALLQPNV